MTTRIIRISAPALIPDLLNKKQQGAPLGWLVSLATEMKRRAPADEVDSIKAFNLDTVYFTQDHKLTAMEVLQEELDAERAKNRLVQGVLRPDGTLVPDAAERLREIFK